RQGGRALCREGSGRRCQRRSARVADVQRRARARRAGVAHDALRQARARSAARVSGRRPRRRRVPAPSRRVPRPQPDAAPRRQGPHESGLRARQLRRRRVERRRADALPDRARPRRRPGRGAGQASLEALSSASLVLRALWLVSGATWLVSSAADTDKRLSAAQGRQRKWRMTSTSFFARVRGPVKSPPWLALGLAAVLFACGPAVAQTEVKLGHVGEPGSLLAASTEEYAKRVNAKLAGKVKVVVYGSSQLGGDKEMLQKVKLGTLDMVLPSTVMSSEVDLFGMFEMPYLVKDREHMKRIEEAVFWPKLAPEAEKKGLK